MFYYFENLKPIDRHQIFNFKGILALIVCPILNSIKIKYVLIYNFNHFNYKRLKFKQNITIYSNIC